MSTAPAPASAFTDAAATEARAVWPHIREAITDPGAARIDLAVHMAEWGRARVAAQDPTQTELDAVQAELHAMGVNFAGARALRLLNAAAAAREEAQS